MKSKRSLLFLAAGLAVGAVAATWVQCLLGHERSVYDWPLEDRTSFAVSQMAFPVDDDHGAGEALGLVRLAYAKLLHGADFAEVARGRSDDPTSEEGGFLGWVSPQEEKMLSGVFMALRPGQNSVPVHTRSGWQIIRRHTFEEGCALERRYRIPTHGFFVPWAGMEGGPDSVSRDEALKLAEQAVADVKSGQVTLEEAAARFTDRRRIRPDAWLGLTGNTGAFRPIYEALENLQPGEYAGPVETPFGWGVLRRGRYLRAVVRHILVMHYGSADRDLTISRSPKEARAMAERILADVEADPSKWNSLVERYSDDRVSRDVGGSMGVLHPGEMPKGFEAFVYDLPVGRIYDKVVETPHGFHVVWRVR